MSPSPSAFHCAIRRRGHLGQRPRCRWRNRRPAIGRRRRPSNSQQQRGDAAKRDREKRIPTVADHAREHRVSAYAYEGLLADRNDEAAVAREQVPDLSQREHGEDEE